MLDFFGCFFFCSLQLNLPSDLLQRVVNNLPELAGNCFRQFLACLHVWAGIGIMPGWYGMENVQKPEIGERNGKPNGKQPPVGQGKKWPKKGFQGVSHLLGHFCPCPAGGRFPFGFHFRLLAVFHAMPARHIWASNFDSPDLTHSLKMINTLTIFGRMVINLVERLPPYQENTAKFRAQTLNLSA